MTRDILSLYSVEFGLHVAMLFMLETAASSQHRHLGCFVDSDQSRDLHGTVSLYNELDIATCAAACRRYDYPYAGLQMAKYCYCGMAYGRYGTSNACNSTCSTQVENCGGTLANDVFYSIPLNESPAENHMITAYATQHSFDEARMYCIRQGGDITTLTSQRDLADIARSQTDNNISGELWLGLTKTSNGYQWTNPNTDNFVNQDYVIWSEKEQHVHSCVLISARDKRLTSADCSDRHPFLCTVAYEQVETSSTSTASANDDGGRVEAPEDDEGNSSKLAFYVVLPLFFLIYGGSCLVYCIYRSCKQVHRKRHRMFEIRSCESLGGSSASGVQTTSCRSISSSAIADEQVSIISLDTPSPLMSPVSSPERRPVTTTECAVEFAPVGASPINTATAAFTRMQYLNPIELSRPAAKEGDPRKTETSLSIPPSPSSSHVAKPEIAQPHTGSDAHEPHTKPTRSAHDSWHSGRKKLLLPVRSKLAHARSRQLPISHVLREKEAAGVERSREPKIIAT